VGAVDQPLDVHAGPDEVHATAEGEGCRRAFKTTQLCALNFTQGV
jgi:hypothetical protein